tara:strand:- start:2910 stop:3731 length:822 start_codon:yes stop_codon:yes gene_type:complete
MYHRSFKVKLSRRQLEQIILESLSEESFIDKVKKKGKDIKDKATTAVDRVRGEIEDLRGGGSEPVSEPAGGFSNEDEVIRMLKEKYPVPEGKEQKIYGSKVEFGDDISVTESHMRQRAEANGYNTMKYRYTTKIDGELFLFLVFEEAEVKTGRVLAYFQAGEDYVLGNDGKMLFKDASGKRVTLQFRGPNLKPFFRVQGSAGQFQPVMSVQFVIGLGIPGLTPSGPGKVTKEETSEAGQFLRDKFRELGGKPSSVNENLSRGSLYRKRYYGRY